MPEEEDADTSDDGDELPAASFRPSLFALSTAARAAVVDDGDIVGWRVGDAVSAAVAHLTVGAGGGGGGDGWGRGGNTPMNAVPDLSYEMHLRLRLAVAHRRRCLLSAALAAVAADTASLRGGWPLVGAPPKRCSWGRGEAAGGTTRPAKHRRLSAPGEGAPGA
ncbi:hypothetical protein MMPV_002475 [Pyropia vietnamensis]